MLGWDHSENNADLDGDIKTLLQNYFTKFGKVSTEEDLKKLDQLLAS